MRLVAHLIASTAFVLASCGGGGSGSTSDPTAQAALAAVPPAPSDVRVGDTTTSYFSLEIAPSMKYIAWQEPSAQGPSVWIAGIDADTAALIPVDGRGFKVAGTPISSAPQWGIDAQGEFLVTGNQQGQLLQIRPTSATSATVAVLPLPANPTRQYPYPSRLPGRATAYLLYVQNDPQGRQQVWLADLAQPGQERQVTSGPVDQYFATPTFLATIYRWFPGLPQFSYGYNDASGRIQIKVVDVSSGTLAGTAVTSGSTDHVDDFPSVIDGVQSLVGGVSGTVQGALYRRNPTTGQYLTERTFTPVGSQLSNPRFAASIEPFAWNGKSYATFIILDGGGTPGSFPAEVWLTSLSDGAVLRRVSGNESLYRLDPEVFLGRTKAWVFYYGRTPSGTAFELRRAELGLP